MNNEAKLIINSLAGWSKAELKEVVINQIVTYVGIAAGFRVPLLKGVPVHIYSMFLQNQDDEMLDVSKACYHVELHNTNDMEMLLTYGKNIDVECIQSMMEDLLSYLSKEPAHA